MTQQGSRNGRRVGPRVVDLNHSPRRYFFHMVSSKFNTFDGPCNAATTFISTAIDRSQYPLPQSRERAAAVRVQINVHQSEAQSSNLHENRSDSRSLHWAAASRRSLSQRQSSSSGGRGWRSAPHLRSPQRHSNSVMPHCWCARCLHPAALAHTA